MYSFSLVVIRSSALLTSFPYTTLFRSLQGRRSLFSPLASFTTRRSSDLDKGGAAFSHRRHAGQRRPPERRRRDRAGPGGIRAGCLCANSSRSGAIRSEEHTSELQSLRHLVCRLLLEKKKNITYHNNHTLS